MTDSFNRLKFHLNLVDENDILVDERNCLFSMFECVVTEITYSQRDLHILTST